MGNMLNSKEQEILNEKVTSFTGEKSPKGCQCDHKLLGTGAVFYQSVGVLQCAVCDGWQLIRKRMV